MCGSIADTSPDEVYLVPDVNALVNPGDAVALNVTTVWIGERNDTLRHET